MTAINGQSRPCAFYTCEKPGTQKCGRCEQIFYCSALCQRADWVGHKKVCKSLADRKIEQISPPSGLSVAQRIANLKSTLVRRDSDLLASLRERYADWNTLEAPPEYLKPLDKSEEEELLSLILFLAEDTGAALYNEFGTVPGVRMIEPSDCIRRDPPQDCAYYAFHKEPWYNSIRRQSFFDLYERVISFLGKQGYSPTLNPNIGDIVAYSSAFMRGGTAICHYGIVSKIEDKTIYVHSKWNEGHVFEHSLNAMPQRYGQGYTFLTKCPT